jgi:DNA-binding beta-propeller fold protein YncE
MLVACTLALGVAWRATAAEINGPCALALDGHGTLYIAELVGRAIRGVDLRTHEVRTVRTRKPFEIISGLALDPVGNLFVLDSGKVRRVQVNDGSMQDVVAGGYASGWFAGDGGPAIAATLSLPMGLAFDRAGNLYIADTSNGRIRRVDAVTGIIQTVAGNGAREATGARTTGGDGGPALQAGLAYANSVAIDEAGDLFISQSGYDPGDNRIRRVDARTGIITTVHQSGGAALVLDRNDNIFFIDGEFVRSIYAKTGALNTVAGAAKASYEDGGLATRTRLNGPSALAIDADGNLFIAEYKGNRVRRVDARTGRISTIAGNGLPHRNEVIM